MSTNPKAAPGTSPKISVANSTNPSRVSNIRTHIFTLG